MNKTDRSVGMRASLCALMLVLAAVSLAVVPSAFARGIGPVNVGDGDPVAEAPTSTTFTLNNRADDLYVNSSTTPLGNVSSYVFITQDPAKNPAITGSATTPITYNGATYTATVTYIPVTTMTVNGTETIQAADINMTFSTATAYFFDDGWYVDSNRTGYARFMMSNLSLIGLNKDSNGEPTAKIARLPRLDTESVTQIRDTMERYTFTGKNVYLENLTFDGLGKNLYPIGTGSGGFSKSRGEYFFCITNDTGGFYAKDLIIQNVGKTQGTLGLLNTLDGSANKNIAICVMFTDPNGGATTGQRNLEDITLRNIQTWDGSSAYPCSPVQLNQTHDVYFKDLYLEDTGFTSKTNIFPVSVDLNATTHIAGGAKGQKNLVFAGDLKFPTTTPAAYKSIFIKDCSASNVSVPSRFKFASMGTAATSFGPWETLATPAANTAYLELDTSYWVTQNNGTQTLTQQFTSIAAVVRAHSVTSARTTFPNPNIKVIADANAETTGFTIPDFSASTAYNKVVNPVLVALTRTDTPTQTVRPATSGASGDDEPEYVTYKTGTALALPATNPTRISLFNFDFYTNPHYFLTDSTGSTGKIPNSSESNFHHDLFTEDTFDVSFIDYDDSIVSTETVSADTTATPPAAPTREGHTFLGWSLTPDDDVILTADEIAQIPVVDDVEYYARYEINSYLVSFVDFDGSTITTQSVDYNDFAVSPSNPQRNGYTFAGWSLDPNGGGLLLTAAEINALPVTEDVTYYAIYKANDPSDEPTPTPTPVPGGGSSKGGYTGDSSNLLLLLALLVSSGAVVSLGARKRKRANEGSL